MRFLLVLALLVPGVALADSRPAGGPGPTTAQLRLSATIAEPAVEAGKPILVKLELANAGKQPVKVVSHVAAHETHYDPFTLTLYWPSPSAEGCNGPYTGKRQRTIKLVDTRDKSAPVTVSLEPGKSIVHELDVNAWAQRAGNGGTPLGAGTYLLRAEYTMIVRKMKRVVRSQVVGFTIAGTPSKTMCRKNPGWRFFGPAR